MEKSFRSFGELKNFWDKKEEEKKAQPATGSTEQPSAVEQELSPEVVEKIMEKVKDVTDEQTRKDLGAHNMGGEGGGIDTRNIQGGLFKTEKVLTHGLLSPRFANKVGVRTSFGYGGILDMVEMHPLSNDNYYKRGTMPKAWSVLVDAAKVPADNKKMISSRFAERRIPPKYFAGITVDHQLLDEDLGKWLENHGSYEELILTMYEGGVIKKSESADAKTKSLADMSREENRLSDQHLALSGYGATPSPQKKVEIKKQQEKLRTAIQHTKSELIQDIERSLRDDDIQRLRTLLNEQEEKAREYDNTHVDEKRRYLTSEYREQAYQLWGETGETKRKLVSALLQAAEIKERFKGVKTFRDYLNKVCAQYRVPLYSDTGLEFPVKMSYEELKKYVADREAKKSKPEQEE